MHFAAGIALALSSLTINGGQVQSAPVLIPAAPTVQEYIESYFADIPVMIDVARCESHFKQFDKDGSALKNPNSTATGVFQIMSSIHADAADANLGLDIYSLQGNAAYARYLYETQGLKPWAASASCWNKSGKIALK
jgi:hypothetical protein